LFSSENIEVIKASARTGRRSGLESGVNYVRLVIKWIIKKEYVRSVNHVVQWA
jgi:hypothetical protein